MVLDGRWTFREHFRAIAPKAERFAAALGRLLPNLGGGPSERVRRLYVGTVHSLLLYGAPIWAGDLDGDRASVRVLSGAQRRVCLRLVRGYRTVSQVAVGVLAGVPPIHLLSRARARAYWASRRGTETGEVVPARDARRAAEAAAVDSWLELLGRQESGLRMLGAVVPVFRAWLERRHGRLTYRLTQFLTGHGCFGAYLHRIGREETPTCWFCRGPVDSVEHTLSKCPRWDGPRGALRRAMAWGDRRWAAFQRFAEDVLAAKEAEERRRERDGLRDRRRRRRAATEDGG